MFLDINIALNPFVVLRQIIRVLVARS